MLWLETAGGGAKDADDLAVVASQLDALGLRIGLAAQSQPEALSRHQQFELAPYLVDGPPTPEDRVVLLAANRLTDATLARLRRLVGPEGRPCLAFGRFGRRQKLIGITARLSYALGRDPEVFDLGPEEAEDGADCPIFGVARRTAAAPLPRLLLAAPPLEDRQQAAALVGLALSRQFRTAVLTDGRSKQLWIAAHGTSLDIYQYGEILPASLAERVDVCVCFAPLQGYARMQCLAANLAVSGGALIDGTADHSLAGASDAFIRGPIDVAGVAPFLTAQILPNLQQIGAQVQASRFAAASGAAPLLRFLGVEARTAARPAAAGGAPGRIVFMPTNGVGLGHAQRCTLIAAELDRGRSDPVFAAFPSCTRLIKSRGFDVVPLVGRSGRHAQVHANDLPNALRLRALTRDAAALVFDGGHVFDSVCRAIHDNRLRGVWIRRGLWQASKDNRIALDREKVFDRVIVPREAFDELNVPYSHGERVREVGPIVQRMAPGPERRQAVHERLAARYQLDCGRLVVTLLGGGVASDRSAQIQALCGMLARRRAVLHLVVVWPSAVLQPSWFGWPNSRIVRTQHAGVLAAAADLCITAAGYNSFHEVIYNRIPAVFVPQTGSFLDDQPTRAAAAAHRGLAALVQPHELMKLEREIGRYLDDGEAEAARARMAALELPEPGNAAAARLIEEASHGHGALERDPAADRTAGRR